MNKRRPLQQAVLALCVGTLAVVPVIAARSGADCAAGKRLYEEAVQIEDLERRVALLDQARQQCLEFNVLYELGRAQLKRGDLAQAERLFAEAGNLPETDEGVRSKSLVALGNVLEKKGDVEAAVISYRQALRLKKNEKVEAHLLQLELEKGESLIRAPEIVRSLAMHRAGRAFGVEAGVNLPVQFEYDRDILTKDGRAQAAELAESLLHKDFQGNSFVLLGHTDLRGSDEYNQGLSEQRAAAVKQFLIDNYAIEPGRIRCEGYGRSRPLYHGDSEEVHRLNRRVEVRVE